LRSTFQAGTIWKLDYDDALSARYDPAKLSIPFGMGCPRFPDMGEKWMRR
jgi:hypothetical protein